jgi:cytochrome P450
MQLAAEYHGYYLLSRVEQAKYVLVERADAFVPVTDFGPLQVGQGVSALNFKGTDCYRRRHLTEFAFQPHFIEAYSASIPELTIALVNKWRSAEFGNLPISVWSDLVDLHYQILVRSLLGVSLENGVDPIRTALDTLRDLGAWRLEALGPQSGGIPSPLARRFQKAMVVLNEFTLGLIRARRLTRPDTDVLSNLIHASAAGSASLGAEDDIQEVILTLLMTGYTDTANTLTWSLYRLSQDFTAIQNVQTELLNVGQGQSIRYAQLDQLQTLKDTIRGNLRLYPPNCGLLCMALADVDIEGHPIPARAVVFLPNDLLQKLGYTPAHSGGWEAGQIERSADGKPAKGVSQRSTGRLQYSPAARFAFTKIQYTLALLLQNLTFIWLPNQFGKPTLVPDFRPASNFRISIPTV